MERAGPTPTGGVHSPDLVALARRDGPFATVWFEPPAFGDYSRAEDEVGLEHVRRALTGEGCPEPVGTAVLEALEMLPAGIGGAVVIADIDGVQLVDELEEAPRRSLTRWAPLPSLAPVIEGRQGAIPAVVVLADRRGADLAVITGERAARTVEVPAAEGPARKVAPGGWSQPRYQERVDNTWKKTAAAVVARLVELAGEHHPELVILGGDVRAVQLIEDDLPDALRALTREISSGRANDGSAGRRQEEVRRLVHTAVAEDTVALLRRFEEEVGRHGLAANGPAATLDSLQASNVDVLLAHDDGDDERTAFFGRTSGLVAAEPEALQALGEEAIEDRLVDVAIHGALLGGAQVRIVPDAEILDGGLGALLRWQ